MRAIQTEQRQRWLWLIAGMVISWLGLLIHDWVEFGGPSLESSIPYLLMGVALTITWQIPRLRRIATLLILALGVLYLLGALLSVFPLPIWPFDPEQTVSHYAVHLLWALGEVALLWIVFTKVRVS